MQVHEVVGVMVDAYSQRENVLVPRYMRLTRTLGPHSSSVGSTCAICLGYLKSTEKVLDLPCAHTFHAHCILEWFERSDLCPLCKKKA
jgi:hypothetical protein